jgi:hypothetical protein
MYQSRLHHGSTVPAHVESAISTEQTGNFFDVSGGRPDDAGAVAGLPPGHAENLMFQISTRPLKFIAQFGWYKWADIYCKGPLRIRQAHWRTFGLFNNNELPSKTTIMSSTTKKKQ